MITRVRIEAEGSTPQGVMQQLEVAHERLTVEGDTRTLNTLFGDPTPGGARPGLSDAQMGECVIERFARVVEEGDRAGHGGVVYKGRMTAHYARPQKLEKLTGHSNLPMGPHAETPAPEGGTPIIGEHTDPEVARHAQYEVTSTQGSEVPVDRVPALNVSTDAELTRERLIATWNENVPPVQRPGAQPLRLYVVPGDTWVRAMQLWQTDEQLRVLYERPYEHANLSPRQWMVCPPAGSPPAGG